MNRGRAILRRSATWWLFGAALHALWLFLLTVWLTNPALETPLIAWVERTHGPIAGPSYIVAYEYIFDLLFTIQVLGLLAWAVAGVRTWREAVRRHRMERNLCSACAYPIGTSAVCTECGSDVERA